MRRLLRRREIIPSNRGPHKVQDPYTIGFIPQVLGACRAALDTAATVVRIEMNSATDNPLILPDGRSVSGGHFHRPADGTAPGHPAAALRAPPGVPARRTARLLATRPQAAPAL